MTGCNPPELKIVFLVTTAHLFKSLGRATNSKQTVFERVKVLQNIGVQNQVGTLSNG